MSKNQFMVSVADAILIDKDTDAMVLNGKALMNSAFKQSVEEMLIKGGFGNQIQFVFNHDKMVDVSIEDCRFLLDYLAINNNALITTGADNFFKNNEQVTLTAGSGTLATTPIGSVYVTKADGSFYTATPTGATFPVPGGAATTVSVTYQYSTSVDKVVVAADTYPKAYRLILKAKTFLKETGQTQTGELEIIVENYKIGGNYELNLTASGATTSKIDGKALSFNYNGTEAYAIVRLKPTTGTAVNLVDIVASPQTVAISTTGTTTQQLSIIGIQGGDRANVAVASTDCTYSSSVTAKATVSASGLITAVALGATVITVTHIATGYVDLVNVTVT